jgi:hypothetical protein
MSNLRKYAVIALALFFVASMTFSGLSSCTSNDREKQNVKNTGKKTYEPKFNKDGNLWFVKAASGDTIKQIDIEYANTPDRIEYGMMYRKSMDENTGMLFFMGNMDLRSFWMKNTYVSLDIIFIDDQLRIVSIQKNAEPLNTRSLPSTGPAQYVLEVKGGLCDKLGVKSGDKVQFSDI